MWQVLAPAGHPLALCRLRLSEFGYRGYDFPRHACTPHALVSSDLVHHQPEERNERSLGLQRILGLGSYRTAWTWLHKLRRSMVRPGRDRLHGRVEVDETFVGGEEDGISGRRRGDKSLIVVAVEVEDKSIGRIRLRSIEDASANSLHSFVVDSIEPGSTVHTDGWQGYKGLKQKNYKGESTVIGKQRKDAVKLMPLSLLKRWLL